jgi:hypothetical protein
MSIGGESANKVASENANDIANENAKCACAHVGALGILDGTDEVKLFAAWAFCPVCLIHRFVQRNAFYHPTIY